MPPRSERTPSVQPGPGCWPTGMRVNRAEPWPDVTMRVRRIGWIDQQGRVYTTMPRVSAFRGGSLSPLLIQDDELEPTSRRVLRHLRNAAPEGNDRASRVWRAVLHVAMELSEGRRAGETEADQISWATAWVQSAYGLPEPRWRHPLRRRVIEATAAGPDDDD